MVKARYNGPSDECYFIDGNTYEITLSYADDFYQAIDELGDESLVYKDGFTIVEGSEEELDHYEPDPNTDRDILVRLGKKK